MKKVNLTMNEQDKYEVIKKVGEGTLSKLSAEVRLGMTRRTVNRLVLAYRENGKAAFAHGNRGRAPALKISSELHKQIIRLYKNNYHEANMTHFVELLERFEGIQISRPSVEKILRTADILSPKAHRKTKRAFKKELKHRDEALSNPKAKREIASKILALEDSHPSRPRKKYFGELVQADATELVWFGEEKAHLHAIMDDHSGRILGAYFDNQETLNGYYRSLDQMLENYGIPSEWLTDRRTVFDYQRVGTEKEDDAPLTQFERCSKQLGMKLTVTSVPQRKGRIERLWGTLQSRLPIEMRMAEVKTIEEANAFMLAYIPQFNAHFGLDIVPELSVFEEAPDSVQRQTILARVASRKMDGGAHFKFKHQIYGPMDKKGELVIFRKGTEIQVIETLEQELFASVDGEIYEVKELLKHDLQSEEFDLDACPETIKAHYKPSASHPWRGNFQTYLDKRGISQEEFDEERKIRLQKTARLAC